MKRKKNADKLLPVLIISVLFFCCSDNNPEITNQAFNKKAALMGIIWQQTSAEYRALAHQSFNMARMILIKESRIKRKKKKAVIIDIDETVLDTSPYQAMIATSLKAYPHGWKEWCNRAVADEIPGSKDFLNYADSKGYDIFYVSNRQTSLRPSTILNLKKLGFPQIKKDRLLLREFSPSKKERRNSIEKTHYIAVLIGDNLNDFSNVFENKSVDSRFKETEKLKKLFGSRFVIIPNPMYGEWENAIYNHQRGITNQDKIKHIQESLKIK